MAPLIRSMKREKYYTGWERDFVIALVVAAALHMTLFVIWNALPRERVLALPVKTLSVKLGGDQALDDPHILAKATVPTGNTQPVEATITKQFRPADATRSRKRGALQELDKSAADKNSRSKSAQAVQKTNAKDVLTVHASVAKEYVRERTPQISTAPAGDILGNDPKAKQEKVQAYTQTIALWIEKFKIYPAQARQQGMEGSAMVRIRIDRRGNIHYHIISKRTPYPLLDKAVKDMIRRANPVPPVPAGYPVYDEFLEFVLPIRFKLDDLGSG